MSNGPSPNAPSGDPLPQLPPELAQEVRRLVTARLRSAAIAFGIPSLLVVAWVSFVLLKTQRDRSRLAAELQQLRAEAVRFGEPLEIYNPHWGTVIDGVDPAKFPGKDPRDPRRGILLQQYVPLGNNAQTWQIRPRRDITSEPDTPPSVKAFTAQGYAFYRNRDFRSAVAAFENCLQQHPDESDAHHGLAQTYREMGDFVHALASHDRAIETDPRRHDLYWERGLTRLRMRNLDGAISDFLACLERNADFADAANGLGMAYRDKGDYKQSLTHHDDAIALRPERADFYRERGVTWQRQGDQQKAQADFAKARELEPRR